MPVGVLEVNVLRFGIRACLALVIAGCGGQPPQVVEARRVDLGDAQAAPAGAPSSNDTDPGTPPDDAVPPPKSGVIGALRELVKSSSVFEEAGQSQGLDEMLTEADELLDRVRAENRDALRQVNRQVRLGSSVNMLLITVSQLNAADLADSPSTPHLQKLVRRGATFPNYYAGSSTPAVAWWSLLTGQTSGRWTGRETDLLLQKGDHTLGSALWQAGYTTLFNGHWRMPSDQVVDLPLSHGYDQWFGPAVPSGRLPASPELVWSNTGRLRVKPRPADEPPHAWLSLLADDAVRSLPPRERRPWFLHCAWPLRASNSADERRAAVAELDTAIGRLLARLDEAQLTGNTVILLAGEMSPQAGDGSLSEDALRSVLVVVPPGASPKSSVCDDPVAAWDLLPTLLDIGRAQRKPRPLDGVSLWPALGGVELPADRVLYWKQPGASGEQVVRMGPWRAAVAANSKQVRLYNLQTDPESQTDVAGQHPDVLAKVIRQPAAPAQ